jgi:Fe-S-cluster containining protein
VIGVTTRDIARCSIYENRPELCRVYPQVYHYLPEECTFWFAGSERLGSCECDVGACCSVPREGGEPGGAPVPEIAGGAPCKYLVWGEVNEGEEKTACARAPDPAEELERLISGDP